MNADTVLLPDPVVVFARRNPIANGFAILLCIFLVLFPKGGIKAGDVPLTWGYFVLALASLAALPVFAARIGWGFPRLAVISFACTIPFQMILYYSLAANGSSDTGFTISHILNVTVLPLMMIFLFAPAWEELNWGLLMRAIRFCVLWAAVYGIFLFVWRLATGHLLEIPYLTVNAGDAGMIEETKHNDRGGILKLVSTYNNGNVYGVATLILLPLFDWIERRRYVKGIVRLALILTLSRTVWIGILVDLLLTFSVTLYRDFKRFPIIRVGNTLRTVLLFGVMGIIVVVGSVLVSPDDAFLLDPTFGGRLYLLEGLSHLSWLPQSPVGPLGEILYLSVLAQFGVVGLLSILLMMAIPVFLVLLDRSILRDPFRRAALKGLLIYATVAAADAAINYIPVMAFYWFAVAAVVYGPRNYPTFAAMRESSRTQSSVAVAQKPAAAISS